MRSFSFTFLAFSSFAAMVRGDAYDNTAEAASIASSSSTISGAGDYYFTNVATGQTLSFIRQSVTNVFPQDGGDSLAVQFNSDGQARLSGGNNKCISAQWQAIIGRGYDNAAVSYACTVGTGLLTGTDTLETTKQWWYLVPSGTTATPTTTSASTASSSTGVTVVLNAKVAVDSTTTSSDAADASAAALAAVNPSDRLTWICKHDGAWLVAHPGYAELHPECLDDLSNYVAANSKRQRFAKRRAEHRQLAANMRKRGSQTTYFIVAVDHILDQQTRAIGSYSISTPGGYTSTALNAWDQTDNSQLWTIISA